MTDGLGRSISRLRHSRRMGQQDLATAAGVSVDVVRKLEQGQRNTVRMSTLMALANALDVPMTELIGTPRGLRVGAEDSEVLHLRRAVLGVAPVDDEPPSAADLRAALNEAWRLYWSGRYAELARDLPLRIAKGRAFVRDCGLVDRRVAYTLLAELLQLTSALLAHLAHEDLAHLALHAATRAAESSGDELLHAAQQTTRAWVLSRQGLWPEAEHLAVTTAATVMPAGKTGATPDRLAVWGELMRYATMVLARSGRHSEAAEALGLLRDAAVTMGRDRRTRYISVPFGPAVVRMRAVDTAIAAGRLGQALQLAERVEPGDVPPAMTARYLLNVAWAQTVDHRSAAAVATLRRAELLAPGILPHQTITRTIVAELLPRRRQERLAGLVGLARRAGLDIPE